MIGYFLAVDVRTQKLGDIYSATYTYVYTSYTYIVVHMNINYCYAIEVVQGDNTYEDTPLKYSLYTICRNSHAC